jgi:hypothetical protein
MGTGSMCPFLVLRVRRGPYLLSDTLLQVRSKFSTQVQLQ